MLQSTMALVGPGSSGKTTLAALLYAAAVQHQTDTGHKQFLVNADLATLSVLRKTVGELESGRFPAGNVKGDLTRFNFEFQYRTLIPGRTKTVSLRFHDLAGADIQEIVETIESASTDQAERQLMELLARHETLRLSRLPPRGSRDPPV